MAASQPNQVEILALALNTVQTNVSTQAAPTNFSQVGSTANYSELIAQKNTQNFKNRLPSQ
jgi:hypothetical protein